LNPRQQGFLLLTAYLGDPNRKPLTVAQFAALTQQARTTAKPGQQREMTEEDLIALGCDRAFARRVLKLLSQKEQLEWYLEKARQGDIVPVTRVDETYPQQLRKCLGVRAPGTLWARGELSLLEKPLIALVGSRELNPENRRFARELGRQVALQGFCLVSGNARGADRQAQESCLEHGGNVISVVADALEKVTPQSGVLYLSEDGFDLPFSPQRALSRNRIIHSLGQKTFVAQCSNGSGGTWDGTTKNLYNGWSPVFCFDDGSPAFRELTQMGATPVTCDQLKNLSDLQSNIIKIDQ